MKNINILLIIYIIISNSTSITYQATELKKFDTSFVENLVPSSTVETSQIVASAPSKEENLPSSRSSTINEQNFLNYQPDRFPIKTIKYILSNTIDSDYKIDTVCILAQYTNIGDRPLENINIYEIVPPENIVIINSSSAIITSSIDEIERYKKRSILFGAGDILRPDGFAKDLVNNNNISYYINSTNPELLNNSLNCNKKIISNFLNELIDKIDFCNKTIFNPNQAKPFMQKHTLKIMKLCKDNNFQKDDRIFFNFNRLRDRYPDHLLTCGNMDFQEVSIDEIGGCMHIHIPNMRPKESLLFKYYVNISNYGTHRTTTIIRHLDNKYPDFLDNFIISFPYPKFSVSVDLPKTKFSPSHTININYIVDFFPPENESAKYKFNTSIENMNNYFYNINGTPNLIFKSNKNSKCTNISAISFQINDSGLYNIPVFTIGDDQDKQYFKIQDEKYIEIEEIWKTQILGLTLLFLAFCTLIGGNLECISRKEKESYRIVFSFAALIVIISALKLIELFSIGQLALIFLFGTIFILYRWRSKFLDFLRRL